MKPRPLRDRFDEKWIPEPNSGCWLWTGKVCEKGYGRLTAGAGTQNRCRAIKAYRASWELHRGPIPNGLHVLHKCDTPCCVNPDHLFLGTNADNVADKMRKGRGVRKLTAEQVSEIRRAWASGESQGSIARRFGLTQTGVSTICRRVTWRHVA